MWPSWPVSLPSVLPLLSLTVAGIVTLGATAFAFVASPGSLPTVVTPSPFGSPPVAVKSLALETCVFSAVSSRASRARVTAALPAERWSASTAAGVVRPFTAGPMPAPSAGPMPTAATGAALTGAGATSGTDCRSGSRSRPYRCRQGAYKTPLPRRSYGVAVERPQLRTVGARRREVELRALGGGVRACVERRGVAAHRLPEPLDPRREAPLERPQRAREHDRVRRPVAHPGEPHERLREHVVQAVEGRVDRVAGQQRGERERVAVGAAAARPGAGDQTRGLERGERRNGVRARRARALGGVAERVQGARGQLGLGLGGRQQRVVDHHGGTDVDRARRRARRLAVHARHLGAGERGGDRHRARRAARGAGERLRDVDHAAAAERDDPVLGDRAEQLAGELVHAPGRHVDDRVGGLDDLRRGGVGPLGREKGVARPTEHADGLGGRPAAEADHPLAVLPGEAPSIHPLTDITPRTAAATRPGTARRSVRARARAPRARRARAPRSRAGPWRRPEGCAGAGSRPTAGGRARAPARPAAAAARSTPAPTAARSGRARSAAPWPAPSPRARRRSAPPAASPARRSSTAPGSRRGARPWPR